MIDRTALVLCCFGFILLLVGFVDFVDCFKLKEKNDKRLSCLTRRDGFEEELTDISRGRKPPRQSLLTRLLPMFIIPYLVQSALLPLLLMSLKALLLNSLLVGKLALLLGLVNALRTRSRVEEPGYQEHDMGEVMKAVYGYKGGVEMGAYVNH